MEDKRITKESSCYFGSILLSCIWQLEDVMWTIPWWHGKDAGMNPSLPLCIFDHRPLNNKLITIHSLWKSAFGQPHQSTYNIHHYLTRTWWAFSYGTGLCAVVSVFDVYIRFHGSFSMPTNMEHW
jgi:hypothetical protein